MISLVGRAITGKMLWVVGGALLAMAVTLAGTGWLLKGAWQSAATAKAEAKAAEAAMVAFQDAMNAQATEVERANQRYIDLDRQFADLQAQKTKIQTVVRKEFIYVRDSKKDPAVEAYLSTRTPGAIRCLLDETCHPDQNGGSVAAGGDDDAGR